MKAAPESSRNGDNKARSSGECSPGEKENVPAAPLSQHDWICGPEPYKNTHDQTTKDPWKECHDVVDMNDKEFCKQISKEISWLLVVAGLFLGVITGFTTTSLRWLQANPEEAMVDLLRSVVQLLNDPGSQTTIPPPQPFVPKNHYIVVNQLWFLSMTLTIGAVVVGTLCLQWLSAFRRADVKHMPHDDALALRQLRFDGLMAWGVPFVPAALLVAVQSALVLFAIGLLYLLWSVNRQVAFPVAVVGGVSVILLALTTTMPLLQSVGGWILPKTLTVPQCPYKSPISWAVHRLGVSLATICSFPFVRLSGDGSRISGWHERQLKLLPDFLWQEYDELWRRQRERRGPQSSKTKGYSYYLARALASAMGALIFRDDVHIIHGCLQDFHGTKAEVETLKELFKVELTGAEESLLQGTIPHPTQPGNPTVNHPSTLKRVHLRRDFLNAHTLQHFAKHNQKLHRTLLPQRVELYVRIKNSPYANECTEGELEDRWSIGSSVECPIRSLHDAQQLSAESQIQFLRCADRVLDTGGLKYKDNLVSATRHVLEAAQSSPTTCSTFPPPAQSPPSVLPSDEGQENTEELTRPLHERLSTTATLVNNTQNAQSSQEELFIRILGKLPKESSANSALSRNKLTSQV